jgi:hypothetical protein
LVISGTGRLAHLLGMLLTNTTTTITETTKTTHPERIVGVGRRALEQFTEDLVIPIDREFEALLNERFLGSGLVPPGPLELEDRFVTFGEFYSGDFHHL